MQPITRLSEHLQKEELERLTSAWQDLTPLQRKFIRLRVAVGSFGPRSLHALNQYIARRRASFAYLYLAHWL